MITATNASVVVVRSSPVDRSISISKVDDSWGQSYSYWEFLVANVSYLEVVVLLTCERLLCFFHLPN